MVICPYDTVVVADKICLLPAKVSLMLKPAGLTFACVPSANELGGRLPSGLGKLNVSTVLRLGSNQFTGSIPEEIMALSQLKTFDLDGNLLTGTLPSMAELQSLTSFTVRYPTCKVSSRH